MDLTTFIMTTFFLGMASGLPIALPFASPTMRVKMMRSIMKKNYGFVILQSRGNNLTTFVRDLNAGTIKYKNGMWIITPETIYRYEDQKLKEKKVIEEGEMKWRYGIPTLFIDADDVAPLMLVNQKIKDQKVSRNPLHLEAYLGKIRSATELEAMKRTSDQTRKRLLIAIIIGVIAAGAAVGAVAMLVDMSQKVNLMSIQVTSILDNITMIQTGQPVAPIIIPSGG